MKTRLWWTMAACLVVVAGCTPKEGGTGGGGDAGGAAAPSAGGATFASAVQPIFQGKCAKCHIEETKGGLSLASLQSTMDGGKKGPDVVAGDADGSLLYQMVSGQAEKRMPPKGDPLSDAEIATIKGWIDGGAK